MEDARRRYAKEQTSDARDALVKEYEKLLEAHPGALEGGKIMLSLAGLWQSSPNPDHKKQLAWLRKACAALPEGSSDWFEAQFYLVGTIYLDQPEEARRILRMLIEKSPDLRYEVKGYNWLQLVARIQGKFDEMESIAMKLQNIDLYSSRMPKEMRGKGDVYREIQNSQRSLMYAWTEMRDVPMAQREAKIRAFAEKAHFRAHIDNDMAGALESMRGGMGTKPEMGTKEGKTSRAPVSSLPAPLHRFDPGFPVGLIACSPDGKLIAAANDRPTMILLGGGHSKVANNWQPAVKLYDAATGKTIVSLKLAAKEEDALFADPETVAAFRASALAFSPDGTVLAVGTGIGQVKLFDVQGGGLLRCLDDGKEKLTEKQIPEEWKPIKQAMGSIESLAFSPDGRLLATCGWSFSDLAERAPGRAIRLDEPYSGPGRLKLWDVKTGTLKHNSGEASSVKSVPIEDVRTGRLIDESAGHSEAYAVAFSPDGRWLASAGRWSDKMESSGNGVILWDANTGAAIHRLVRTTANAGVRAIAFSPDSKLLALGTQRFDTDKDSWKGGVSVVHAATGIEEWLARVPGCAKPVAFSPDGKTVIVMCGGQSVRFLDTETGILKREVPNVDFAHGARWNDLNIASKANVLVTGGVDKDRKGVVEIWNWDGVAEGGERAEEAARKEPSAREELNRFLPPFPPPAPFPRP